jgi:hypothetical protein
VTPESDWFRVSATKKTIRSVCTSLNPLPTGSGQFSVGGRNWSNGEFNVTRYNHVMPPNTRSCMTGAKSTPSNSNGATTAASFHRGGVNLVLCDGSTRFIRDGISPSIWDRLGNRKDGKPVGDF